MENKKYIGWFSCGITSAIACKMAVESFENVDLYYIGIGSAHSDNKRFISDCEKWIGKEITTITSKKYVDQFEVIEETGFINGAFGARCTIELKKKVRFDIQRTYFNASQIFGFEFSKKEINRAVRFKEQYPETYPVFPLIENRLTKENCAKIIQDAGIELPEMYKLGFPNNNCIGCVKGGAGYWNLIKKHFPVEFNKMMELENELNRTCIKNKFLRDLKPHEGRDQKIIIPDCGSLCQIKFESVLSEKVEKIINGQMSMFDV